MKLETMLPFKIWKDIKMFFVLNLSWHRVHYIFTSAMSKWCAVEVTSANENLFDSPWRVTLLSMLLVIVQCQSQWTVSGKTGEYIFIGWGRVTHSAQQTIPGSNNFLLPVWRKFIHLTNSGIFMVGPWRINLQIFIKIWLKYNYRYVYIYNAFAN